MQLPFFTPDKKTSNFTSSIAGSIRPSFSKWSIRQKTRVLWYVATWKYKILSDRSLTADKDQIFCNDYITKKGSEHLKNLKTKFLKAEITLVHVL